MTLLLIIPIAAVFVALSVSDALKAENEEIEREW